VSQFGDAALQGLTAPRLAFGVARRPSGGADCDRGNGQKKHKRRDGESCGDRFGGDIEAVEG
jgi:hypothetical protein